MVWKNTQLLGQGSPSASYGRTDKQLQRSRGMKRTREDSHPLQAQQPQVAPGQGGPGLFYYSNACACGITCSFFKRSPARSISDVRENQHKHSFLLNCIGGRKTEAAFEHLHRRKRVEMSLSKLSVISGANRTQLSRALDSFKNVKGWILATISSPLYDAGRLSSYLCV